jgi:hypothetical protein
MTKQYATIIPVTMGELSVALTSLECNTSIERLMAEPKRPDGYNNERLLALMADPETAKFENFYEAMDDCLQWSISKGLEIMVLPCVNIELDSKG